MRKSPTYTSWDSMLQRCTNPKSKSFADYGARGITVDPAWRDYATFERDMGPRPDGHQLDWVDNDKGYCKSNCRWATPLANGNNKRNNVRLTRGDQTHSLSEWSRILGKPFSTLFSRHYRGWSVERVLS